MNSREQIDAINRVMEEEVFDNDKVDRINDILNTDISPADLSAAYERGYKLGHQVARSNTTTIMLVWSGICAVSGILFGSMVI